MSQFNDLYKKIINKTLIVSFDQYFDFQFYVNMDENRELKIRATEFKGADRLQIKCRKLSLDHWQYISKNKENEIQQKLLLMFSIVETNFIKLQFDHKGFLLQKSLQQLLNIDCRIINYIIKKINKFYYNKDQQKYRAQVLTQFQKLYASEKGIVLKHKQISQYLQYCNFWEKLGLNYYDVKTLPYDVYKTLVMMLGVQSQVKNAQLRKLNAKTKRR